MSLTRIQETDGIEWIDFVNSLHTDDILICSLDFARIMGKKSFRSKGKEKNEMV